MSDTTDGYGTWPEKSVQWPQSWARVVAAREAGASPETLQELTEAEYIKVFGKKILGSDNE